MVARVEQLAFAAKLSFKSGLSIKDAITRAYEIEDLSTIKIPVYYISSRIY